MTYNSEKLTNKCYNAHDYHSNNQIKNCKMFSIFKWLFVFYSGFIICQTFIFLKFRLLTMKVPIHNERCLLLHNDSRSYRISKFPWFDDILDIWPLVTFLIILNNHFKIDVSRQIISLNRRGKSSRKCLIIEIVSFGFKLSRNIVSDFKFSHELFSKYINWW